MDVVDLLEFLSSPIGFKRGTSYIRFGIVGVINATPSGMVLPKTVDLAPDEVAYILAVRFNVWNGGGIFLTHAQLEADLGRFTIDIQHNDISLLDSPAESSISTIANWLTSSFHVSPFVTGGLDRLQFSASGNIPVFKRVGPGGRIEIGLLKHPLLLAGSWNLAGHAQILITKN